VIVRHGFTRSSNEYCNKRTFSNVDKSIESALAEQAGPDKQPAKHSGALLHQSWDKIQESPISRRISYRVDQLGTLKSSFRNRYREVKPKIDISTNIY